VLVRARTGAKPSTASSIGCSANRGTVVDMMGSAHASYPRAEAHDDGARTHRCSYAARYRYRRAARGRNTAMRMRGQAMARSVAFSAARDVDVVLPGLPKSSRVSVTVAESGFHSAMT